MQGWIEGFQESVDFMEKNLTQGCVGLHCRLGFCVRRHTSMASGRAAPRRSS